MTLTTTQAMSNGMGKVFCTFSVTDASLGNPTFHLGDQNFSSTNVHGGARVSPVVKSWGALANDMAGAETAEILLIANAECVPSNGTTKAKVIEWIRKMMLSDVALSVYQWNAVESTQELIWRGYIAQIGEMYFSGGEVYVSLLVSAVDRTMERTEIAQVVNKTDFPQAPIQSVGQMPPIVFGNANNTLQNYGNAASLANCGFPMPGVRGVITDEDDATAKIKIRLAYNDGAVATHTFAEPTTDDASTSGDLWIYDAGMGAYGMVDNAAYSFVNDTAKLEVTVDASPKVFFFIRPSQVGSAPAAHAGLTDIHNLIDSDPSNYSTSTTTDYAWAFYLPNVSFGGRIKSVGVVVDWENAHATENRRITFGIYDDYFATGPGPWLRNKFKTTASLAPSATAFSYQGTAAERYVSLDFTDHSGNDTNDAFAAGSFVTNNGGNTLQTGLQLRVIVEDLGGAHAGFDGVRVYNVGFLVEVDYPVVPRGIAVVWTGPKYWDDYKAEDIGYYKRRMMEQWAERTFGPTGKTALQARRDALSRQRGTDFFARGRFRKDTAGGLYTGSASDVITKPCDIAYYILHKICGKTVNTTASTLGNFTDARASTLMSNANTLISFGPDPVFPEEAIQILESKYGMEVFDEGGVQQCIPQDMNPHSSRVYRSTSAPVQIGPGDLDVSSIQISALNPADIENAIQFNFSHGYPDREPGAQFQYENHYSQKFFGRKRVLTIDEPCCIQQNLRSATQQHAKDLAWWHGWKKGRPRLTIKARMPQGFYDLKRGHTVQLVDLEDVGIVCPAFRAGLVDYYFTTISGSTDYGISAAPVFISLSGPGTLAIGLQEQTDGITFAVATAAGYTTVVNGWKYSSSAGGSGTIGTTAFTGVVNADALKTTGIQRVSWNRPNYWAWQKGNLTIGATTCGPAYWITMDYTAPTIAGLGNDVIKSSGKWADRVLSVLKAVRTPGTGPEDYPAMEAMFVEVM